jgi:hypothetical protein
MKCGKEAAFQPRSRHFLSHILAPLPARSHVKSCPLIDKTCHFSVIPAFAALRKTRACARLKPAPQTLSSTQKMDEAIFTFMTFKFSACGIC